MKLSQLKNIIRKTLKESQLTETIQCYEDGSTPGTVSQVTCGPGQYCNTWSDMGTGELGCHDYADKGPKPGTPDDGGFTPDDEDFTPDFAKNTPRAVNVRPTTLTEDKNKTMKLSQLKQIIKEEVKSLNEASRSQRPDWFPPHPDVPYGEYGHMPESSLNEGPVCWGTVNSIFGMNMPGGDACKQCGGCGNAGSCNGTNLFDTADECNCHHHGTGCPDGGDVTIVGRPREPMGLPMG